MILAKGECNLKDWVKNSGMSGRCQSELIAAIRGADADDSPEVKRVVRWIRRQVVKETNPKSHFMKDVEFVRIKALMEQDAWQWDRLRFHFRIHLKQALLILAYYHPDQWVMDRAFEAVNDLNESESLITESKTELIARTKDESPIAIGEWVVQDWLFELPGRMQSILFCALRGSDIATADEVRRVTRWLRYIVMKNVMPSSHYMADREFMRIEEQFKQDPSWWGNLPIHFKHHTSEALETVAYMHPDAEIRGRALQAYEDLCYRSKGKPESKDAFTMREQDKPGRIFETVQRTNLPVNA